MTPLALPHGVRRVAEALSGAGGRPFLVGGGVRDHLSGRAVTDWDLEVFGLDVDAIADALRALGRVDAVGRSFGVLKARPRGWIGPDIDVSLPRSDSKVGPGHRGIHVQGDPHMPLREAARRRDLTINAMSIELPGGALVDPFGGQRDLTDRLLRAVDADTFLEDPLRALRVARFAARLDFDVDPALVALCRNAAVDELPPERVGREWEKVWLSGVRPSRALRFARDCGVTARTLPGLVEYDALDAAADAWASNGDDAASPGRRWAGALALWMHATPEAALDDLLDRLDVHSALGVPVRRLVLALHAARALPIDDERHCRHIAAVADLRIWLTVRGALAQDFDRVDWTARAELAGIADAPPEPLLRGRDLAALGVPSGRAMGALLAELYTAQLDGEVASFDEAIAWARARIRRC
jgi:tRNA nucleotidyltransferase (CCA-adding enzyme)